MQPPSGGCVLKLTYPDFSLFSFTQPPSGGCVLKQRCVADAVEQMKAAAFGRLCVETKTGYINVT